jgi:hypothetical protein
MTFGWTGLLTLCPALAIVHPSFQWSQAMNYCVMQSTEDGQEFCAVGGFCTVEAAEDWILSNAGDWPESNFWVEAESSYRHIGQESDWEDIPY